MKKKRKPLWLYELIIKRLFVFGLIVLQIVLIISTIVHYKQLWWLNRIMTAISFFTALHLLTRRDKKSSFKLSLIFLIFLFPLFGGALYVILQYQTNAIGFRNRLHKKEIATKHEYRCQKQTLDDSCLACPSEKKQMHYLQNVPGFPVCPDTETVYFSDGNDMLDSILREIRNAKRYIFLEFFIIEEGAFWDPILKELREQVKNGVDVRIIYDDIGCLLRVPGDYEKKLNSYGIFINELNIINWDFSEEYINAVEAKQVAEQNLIKTRTEQEQALVIANTEAQKRVIAAEAEANEIKVLAEANAESNRILTESISELLIKYQTVAKWDGKLPTVMAGSDNMLIDVPLTAEQPVG